MINLIKVTLATSGHVETQMSDQVSINIRSILLVEDYHGNNDANSRILMENGKSFLVVETQDEIRDLCNSDSGLL
jgi:hypothetical protein